MQGLKSHLGFIAVGFSILFYSLTLSAQNLEVYERLRELENRVEQPKRFRLSKCLEARNEAAFRAQDKIDGALQKAQDEFLNIRENLFNLESELPEDLNRLKVQYEDQKRTMEQQLLRLENDKKAARLELTQATNRIDRACREEGEAARRALLQSQVGTGVSRDIVNATSIINRTEDEGRGQTLVCKASANSRDSYKEAEDAYRVRINGLNDERQLLLDQLSQVKDQTRQQQEIVLERHAKAKEFAAYQEERVKLQQAQVIASVDNRKQRQNFQDGLVCFEDILDKYDENQIFKKAKKAQESAG